jgi:Ca-activated chloride channel family protein
MAVKDPTSPLAPTCWLAGLLIFGSGLGWLASGQQQQKRRPDPDQGEVIELRSDLVSFTVSVLGGTGQALMNLKPEDFIVFENGERQKITHFATVDAPVDIVLAIDTSGSMQGDHEIVRKAATSFIERMRPQDRIAIVEFGRDVNLSLDWTKEPRKARDVIKAINSKKPTATAFYDSLYVISDELLRTVQGRKAVILLSDGVDSLSYYEYQPAASLLERSGAAVYFVEIDTEEFTVRGLRRGDFTLSPQQLERYRRTFRPDDLPIRYRDPGFFFDDELERIARGLYKIAQNELRQLADRTGGRVFPLKRLEDLNDIYAKIAAELGTLYSIGYYPSNSKHDGQWRPIRVEVNVSGAQVLARSGYWAPKK